MARLIFGIAVVIVVVSIYSIVDCAMTPRQRIRGLPKAVWLLVVLVIPVVGPALWFLIGREHDSVRPEPRVVAPDDDPEFLRQLRAGGRPVARPVSPAHDAADDAEQLRLLEAELAKLDDDGDGSRG